MIDYSQILIRNFDANWVLNGDDYEGLVWLSDSKKPTKKELDDLWPSTQKLIEEEQDQILSRQKTAEDKLNQIGLTVEDLQALGFIQTNA